MGDRDYYLDADQQKIRDEYRKLMAKMFSISGYSKLAGFEKQEKEMAQRVLDLECCMAEAFIDKVVLRDPYQTIHKCTVNDLQKTIPAVNLNEYLKVLNLKLDTLNVGMPTYFSALNRLLSISDWEVMKAYMAWQVINGAAPYLSDEFVNARFDFYGLVVAAQQEVERCNVYGNGYIGIVGINGRQFLAFPHILRMRCTGKKAEKNGHQPDIYLSFCHCFLFWNFLSK